MRKIYVYVMMLLIPVIILPGVFADPVYVDERTGDDVNTGRMSWTNAVKTISRASEIVQRGETMYISQGVYDTALILLNKGPGPDKVTVVGVGKVVLNGAALEAMHCIQLDAEGYFRIENIRFIGFTVPVGENAMNHTQINNCFFENFSAISGASYNFKMSGVDSYISNSIFKNLTSTSSTVNLLERASFFNNVLDNCVSTKTTSFIRLGAYYLVPQVFNNVFYKCVTVNNNQKGFIYSPTAFNNVIEADLIAGFNCIYDKQGGGYFYMASYGGWTQGYHQMIHDRTDNPQFVDADAGLYYLKPGSPLIGRGRPTLADKARNIGKGIGYTNTVDWTGWLEDGGIPIGTNFEVSGSKLKLKASVTVPGYYDIYSPTYNLGDTGVINSINYVSFEDRLNLRYIDADKTTVPYEVQWRASNNPTDVTGTSGGITWSKYDTIGRGNQIKAPGKKYIQIRYRFYVE